MKLQKMKRLFLMSICFILATISCACKPAVSQPNEDDNGAPPVENNANYIGSVTFLDVGNGESILITFPDKKTMLIDCGESKDTTKEKLLKYIDDEWDNKIDYFVYTHPDFEHTGNAIEVLNACKVECVYIPKIMYPHSLLFSDYQEFIELLNIKNIKTIYSDCYKYIKGEGYAVAFLTPDPLNGSYVRFNGSSYPTKEDIDNLSPIIYVDILGVRFLLTGDAGFMEEQTLLEQDKIGFYQAFYKSVGISVNLDNIDYLKVAGGGFNQGSSQVFLDRICPKTAVFFVSGGNYLGNPQQSVLQRLQQANESYRVFRTDVSGNIRIMFNENKKVVEKLGN